MVLCALVPLGVFFLCYRTFGLSFNIAATICVVTGIVSMIALLPLTGLIYLGIVKIGRVKLDNEATVHSTDNGCASLIFVVLFLMLFPVFEKARQNASKHRKANAIHPQAKPMK